MKFFTHLLIITLIVIGIAPNVQLIAYPGSTQATKFAIVFATGGLGDKHFNDAAFRGLELAEAEYGDSINVDYVEPVYLADFATYQNDFASMNDYELIICVGFLQTSALNYSAYDYPDQDWVLIDDVLQKPNVKSFTFKEHEGSFLVGSMAGMVTQTNKIGFLGALDISYVNKFKYGYEQGASYINNDIIVTSVYSPDPTNPWGDHDGGKATAQTMYSAGNDIIFAAAGGTGMGVLQVADETEGVYAIGVDTDQDYIYPGKILCSMIKNFEIAVFTSIQAKMEGTWTPGHEELGIVKNGVAISPMDYTSEIKNAYFVLRGINKTRWEHILDIMGLISGGYLIVSDSSSEYEITKPPITSESTTTTTDSSLISTFSTTSTTPITTAVITPNPSLAFSFTAMCLLITSMKVKKRRSSK